MISYLGQVMNGFLDRQVQCPYCGEAIVLFVDPANNGSHYVEDCSVCCRPINIFIMGEFEGSEYHVERIDLRAEND